MKCSSRSGSGLASIKSQKGISKAVDAIYDKPMVFTHSAC